MAEDFAPPVAFGMPEKFDGWRPGQVEAMLEAIDSPARFVGMAAPTGFGKSATYMGIAAITGLRTCVLTSTKGLQMQLAADFRSMGLAEIKGQNAYTCIEAERFGVPAYTAVADGPCHAGAPCRAKDGGCLYYDAYRRASVAKLVCTNYAYWMHIGRYGEGLGEFELLILDEAHDAPEHLSSFMSVEIESKIIRAVLGSPMLQVGAAKDDWKQWASYLLQQAKDRFDTVTTMIRNQQGHVPRALLSEAHDLKRIRQKLEVVAGMAGEWVWEATDKGVRFDAVWPNHYSEAYLFKGTPKILLVSATVRPKTAEILGIDPDQLAFNEYASAFPVARRPVIHVPTVQLNHRADASQIRLWLQRIDQIVSRRTDRKGIIHTVSYRRAREVYEASQYKHLMMVHGSNDARTTIARFKAATHPCILVSPSVTTGYDFPYEECEYQIIGKIPFPDNRAAVIKARMQLDKEYSNYMAMQQLVQACGRGMRAEDDQCETLVIDDSIRWFLGQNKRFAPKWWLDSVRTANALPQPLPKL